jgi:hypothetical protein
MLVFRPTLIFLVMVMVAAALPARAQDQPSPEAAAFRERLLAGPLGKDKSYACFVRVYDAAHLAKHPLQKVSAMKLLMTVEQEPDARTTQNFRLGLKFRKRAGDFDSSGYCGDARNEQDGKRNPRIGCSVDCDGGGIEIALTPDNKSAMLYVESVRIWLNNKPDDEASTTSLKGGADDRVFRLDRASLDQCRSLVHDRKELAAMRHVSNRR